MPVNTVPDNKGGGDLLLQCVSELTKVLLAGHWLEYQYRASCQHHLSDERTSHTSNRVLWPNGMASVYDETAVSS